MPFARFIQCSGWLAASLLLAGCMPPAQALKPVATQNQENIAALSTNAQVLLSLYEPMLQASADAVIKLHIGKTRSDLIAVVGPPNLPPPDENWDELFENKKENKEKYYERYHYVRAALARGISDDDSQKLKQQEGWIYNAAADPNFTPPAAHALLKDLADVRKSHSDDNEFFRRAETRMLPHDPVLQQHRQAADAALLVLNALKQEIANEVATARLHSQALLQFAGSEVDLREAAGNLDKTQIYGVLGKLSQAYIKNPLLREAALRLLGVKTDAMPVPIH
jgi:hypothetical protein